MSEEKRKVIEIQPLSKWKRILLYLGDYFIAFIFSFILFNLAVFPLTKVICGTEKKAHTRDELGEVANNLLIDNGIVFEDPEGDFELTTNVNYTFKVFLSYYAFDEETVDVNHKQYGHKEENEVIRHYYVTYMHNTDDGAASYLADFKEVNKEDSLFIIGETVNDIKLKSEYKELLGNELLEVQDEDKYSTNMTNFRDHIFAKLFYLHVYEDITTNDFVKDGVSYNECYQKIKSINEELKWIATWPAIISMVLSWGIVYLLYPMINGERRTMTMSVMKLNKLKMVRMVDINRKDVALQSFYYLLLSMSSTLFLPVLYFGFAYCFNLPLLFVLTVISLVLTITSLFFVLFNEHGRSGSDILTFSVVVPTSQIDNIYKEKLDNEGSISSTRTFH